MFSSLSQNKGLTIYTTDYLGSVRFTTNSHNPSRQEYNYDAFGVSLGKKPELFGYNGKVYDGVTTNYDYGFRDYAPRQARFTTVDPIQDGNNWYAYVNNDPVNLVDPDGLEGEPNLIDVARALIGAGQTKAYLEAASNPSPVSRAQSTAQTAINGVSLATLNKVEEVVNDPLLEQGVKGAGEIVLGTVIIAGSVVTLPETVTLSAGTVAIMGTNIGIGLLADGTGLLVSALVGVEESSTVETLAGAIVVDPMVDVAKVLSDEKNKLHEEEKKND